jgi:hypothetical protein
MNNENLNLVERIVAPTPKWFRTLRMIGLTLATVGGTIIASPVVIPAAIITVAQYLVLGGGIISAVSQTAVQSEESTTE